MEDAQNKNIKIDNEMWVDRICDKISQNSYELETKVLEPINALRSLIEHLKELRTNCGMPNMEHVAEKTFDDAILEIDRMLDKLKYDKKGELIRIYTKEIHAYIRGLRDKKE